MAKSKSVKVITPVAILSYPFLASPRPSDDPAHKPKFSAELIFPAGSDLANLRKAIAEVCRAEGWENGVPDGGKEGIRNGQGKADRGKGDHYAGAHFITANSYNPVALRVRENGVVSESVNPVEDFYPGCMVRAEVAAQTFDTGTNFGVKFWLNAVMRVGDGTRLAGGGCAFDDPNFNLDDDPPF